MLKFKVFILTICFTINMVAAQEISNQSDKTRTDENEVRKLINNFIKGIDKQKGEQIIRTFYEGSSLYAFAPDGKKIITVSAKDFARLHEEKKFGGQERKLEIKDLTITDGILASANVTASNETVFYNYRLTFIKQEGKWLILNMMQRSRPQYGKSKQ